MKHFEVTPGFILLLSLLLFTNNMFIIFLAALLLHELAHISTALLLGGSIVSCRLSVAGGYISVNRLSYGREAIAVAAGPAASLAAAFIASSLGYYMLAGINLSLGMCNLLPARCLDGGRLIELCIARGGGSADRALRALTLISSLLLLIPLGVAFHHGVYNWSLILFGLFLLFSR